MFLFGLIVVTSVLGAVVSESCIGSDISTCMHMTCSTQLHTKMTCLDNVCTCIKTAQPTTTTPKPTTRTPHTQCTYDDECHIHHSCRDGYRHVICCHNHVCECHKSHHDYCNPRPAVGK